MEIEELFCKRYPEYSVNGKPLHPYFDIFEEGYEQAEKENEELRNNGFTVSAMTEQQLKAAIEKGEQLEKENAELKESLKKWKDAIYADVENYNDQLTKAKHYIKELVRAVESSYSVLSWQRPPIKAEAEQFLKEIEK